MIQDQAEGAAYMAAINAPDPAQKAQQMESFLQTYPNSVAKEDGYEFLVKTYQQLGNVAKVKSSAASCLQANPSNITSLVFLTVLNAQDNGPDAAASLQAAGQYGARCVKALETAAKPEGVADAQWEATKTQFRTLCNTYLGYASLQGKDYPTAQTALKAVVAANPTDNQSIYLLAISYLSPKPIVVDGLFWIAKAAGNDPKFMSYAQNRYQRYHGAADGFDALLAAAKAEPTIPAGFTVTPAPSPADQDDSLPTAAVHAVVPASVPLKLPSTYVSAQNSADKLHLDADNSFSLQESSQPYHGTFVVNGGTLELNISETSTKTTLSRQGNDLIDTSGQTWKLRE